MAQLLSGNAGHLKNEKSIISLAMISIPVLKKLPHDTKTKLQSKMTGRMLTAGSAIHLGGGKRNDIFFIVMGKAVGVDAQMDTTHIEALDVGDVFCERTRISGAHQLTSVTMTTNCVVCSIHAEDYVRIVAMHDRPVSNILWGVSDALKGFSAWANGGAITTNARQHV